MGIEVLKASFLYWLRTHSQPTRKSLEVMWPLTSPLTSHQSTSSRRWKVQTEASSLCSQLEAMAGTGLP